MKPRLCAFTVVALVILLLAGSRASVSAQPAAAKAADSPGVQLSDEEIFSYVQDLTSIGYRRTGTPAGKEAAEYVKDKFTEFGISQTSIEETGSFSWTADQWGLKVAGKSISSFPVHTSFKPASGTGSFSTGTSGLTSDIVDVGSGPLRDDVDVSGKIVLFNMVLTPVPYSFLLNSSEFTYDPSQSFDATGNLNQPYLSNIKDVIYPAIEKGAVGFVGVLTNYFDSNEYYNEAYGLTPGFPKPVTIPGVWVTPSDGQAVRDTLADSGQSTKATITLKGSYEPATAMTVIGLLPGQSPETILISSHYDSGFYGGVEDASGTAEVLALARYFAAQPLSGREKSLMFVAFDTHFTGYQSHNAFINKYVVNHVGDLRIVANVSIEHIAKEVKIVDGRLTLTGQPEPRAVFERVGPEAMQAIEQAIEDNNLDHTIVLPATLFGECGPPTDASGMDCAGVPVITMITAPVYLYDIADTADMVASDQLLTVANTFIQIVEHLENMSAVEISKPSAPSTGETAPAPSTGVAAPPTGNAGPLSERGVSLPAWGYALLAGGVMLTVLGCYAGKSRTRRRA
jgi:hypothetical protein